MDGTHEARLVAAAQNGDQDAMAELYNEHVDAVYRYVYIRVSSAAVAEDITSDVFVRALETLAKYERRDVPFLGWLYLIAHGRVIDHYRRYSRRAGEADIEEVTLIADSDPEAETFHNIQSQRVMEHLGKLTEEQQQVITLRFIQGHNLKDTADLMGKTEGAIKGLQFRALQTLSQYLIAEEDLQ